MRAAAFGVAVAGICVAAGLSLTMPAAAQAYALVSIAASLAALAFPNGPENRP